jgi:2-polyprenyl-3-methyl-5-hydroxy-6-metoxy-1,4-benzoquinol methylase
MSERYRFDFSWEGAFGHAVNLLSRNLTPGLVLDLGCGFGPIAEPLAERGFSYVGLDVDDSGLDDLSARGFAVHRVDLEETEDLSERLAFVADGRPVVAVAMLDVLEHLRDTSGFLDGLARAMAGLGNPALILSVPNVAHVDLGVKLLGGRWDVTETGLLDDTHVSLFTHERLLRALNSRGWAECDAQDVYNEISEQGASSDLPLLLGGTPVSAFLRDLRDRADPFGTVYQFVRLFTLDAQKAAEQVPLDRNLPDDVPLLSVILRCRRFSAEGSLEGAGTVGETLASLAGQTRGPVELLVLVSGQEETVPRLEELLKLQVGMFARHPRVFADSGPTPWPRLVNRALAVATGRYVVILDDDQVVNPEWAEAIADLAARKPGQALRVSSGTRVLRRRESEDPASRIAPVEVGDVSIEEWTAPFDLLEYLAAADPRSECFVIPTGMVRHLGLRADENLPAFEEGMLVSQAAILSGIADAPGGIVIAACWRPGPRPGAPSTEERNQGQLACLAAVNQHPLLLPKGSAAKLSAQYLERADMSRRLAEAEQALADNVQQLALASSRVAHLDADLAVARRELSDAQERNQELLESSSWRVTAPLRAASELLHGRRRDASSES